MVSARHFVEVEDFARYLKRRGMRPTAARLALFWALPPAGTCISVPAWLTRARRYRRPSRLCRRTLVEMLPVLEEAGLVMPESPSAKGETITATAPIPAFFNVQSSN